MNGRARHPVTLTARQEAEPPAAMGPEQAAWIRDNAWLGAMRKTPSLSNPFEAVDLHESLS
jgi:hypothetical protein